MALGSVLEGREMNRLGFVFCFIAGMAAVMPVGGGGIVSFDG